MKLLYFPILLVLTGLGTGCQNPSTPAPTPDQLTLDSLEASLQDFSRHSLIPGFAVAIVNENEILYSKGFGHSNLNDSVPFTPMTIGGIASISKTFVALSILKLIEQGQLRLDDPINDILPFPIINPHFPGEPIRVWHLLNHTSTLIDDAFVPYYIGEADICLIKDDKKYDSLPAYLQPNLSYYRMGKRISVGENIRKYAQAGARWYTDKTFLKKKPGTHYQYSNLGASVAAYLVELKSGMSFEAFTQRYIFDPLVMKNTGWHVEDLNDTLLTRLYAHNQELNPTGVVEHPPYFMTNYPVSGLHTNAQDLAKYLMEMIRGANGHGALLTPGSYQTLFQPQPDGEGWNKADSSALNTNFSKAILWSVSAQGYRIHTGGNTGIYSILYFHPSKKRGVLAFCNLRDNRFGDLVDTLFRYEQHLTGQ